MFSLNGNKTKKQINTAVAPEIHHQPEPEGLQPKLSFQITVSKNGTRSVFCNYFDGCKNFQEYFNFKENGKLTQGSFLDYKRLCDTFGIPKSTRCEILAMNNCDKVELKASKVKVLTDSAGFMKWFEEL